MSQAVSRTITLKPDADGVFVPEVVTALVQATPPAPVATQLDLLDGRRKRRAPRVRTPEHLEQVALMQWASLPTSLKRYPELELLHAVPNGGHRFISVAKAMKAEGVKPGVPDLDLPVPRGPFIGLRIELKAKGGKESPPQRWWRERLTAHGHRALVCVGWEEAKRAIETYLALPRMPVGWMTEET